MQKDLTKAKHRKYDFGKQVINFTFGMMFCHFGWMCFLSFQLKSAELFIQFTHDYKWIYLTIFGLTIWKEKFIMTIKTAIKFGLKPKNFDELIKIIPKDTKLPSDNSYGELSGYGYGDGSENIDESEGLDNG